MDNSSGTVFSISSERSGKLYRFLGFIHQGRKSFVHLVPVDSDEKMAQLGGADGENNDEQIDAVIADPEKASSKDEEEKDDEMAPAIQPADVDQPDANMPMRFVQGSPHSVTGIERYFTTQPLSRSGIWSLNRGRQKLENLISSR
jgi:hypothetical protein